MKNSYPILSIVIATYNSASKLDMVLSSLRSQSIQDFEVLLIDGGSTDDIKLIAKKYRARIIFNRMGDPINAKYLGYINAVGDYILFIDHDEVVLNQKSLELKVKIMRLNRNVRAVLTSGYISPKDSHFANNYINEFGDPFSFFIYRLSKDNRYFISTMKKRYKNVIDYDNHIIFNFRDVAKLPLIELCAAASMIDAKYFKSIHPDTLKKETLIPHFFYLLTKKKQSIAIIKDDPLLHYSADTLKMFKNKIRWRIKNNLDNSTNLSQSGYSGREKMNSLNTKIIKYLYIPYAFSVVLPLIDSIYLVLSRRSFGYFWHLYLTLFTASQICYYFLKKLFRLPLGSFGYDGSIRKIKKLD